MMSRRVACRHVTSRRLTSPCLTSPRMMSPRTLTLRAPWTRPSSGKSAMRLLKLCGPDGSTDPSQNLRRRGRRVDPSTWAAARAATCCGLRNAVGRRVVSTSLRPRWLEPSKRHGTEESVPHVSSRPILGSGRNGPHQLTAELIRSTSLPRAFCSRRSSCLGMSYFVPRLTASRRAAGLWSSRTQHPHPGRSSTEDRIRRRKRSWRRSAYRQTSGMSKSLRCALGRAPGLTGYPESSTTRWLSSVTLGDHGAVPSELIPFELSALGPSLNRHVVGVPGALGTALCRSVAGEPVV